MIENNFEIVKTILRKNVEHVNMAVFTSNGHISFDKINGKHTIIYSNCDTVGCIAGHIYAYVHGDTTSYEGCNIVFTADEFLGIKDGSILYYVKQWPKFYYDRLLNANTPKNYVDVICDRIDYFMETGK